jgi:hypothetical protein
MFEHSRWKSAPAMAAQRDAYGLETGLDFGATVGGASRGKAKGRRKGTS